MTPKSARPTYDESLNAYQQAFAAELSQCLDLLPLTKTSRILDVPCGNGFYSQRLAQRLGARGRIYAVDLCDAYLAQTRRRLRRAPCQVAIEKADAYRLPFDDDAFDIVWCAQSLISLNDAHRALSEMKRVLRPGGAVAILESDIFHQILLPWPISLETLVQRAIQDASRAKFGSSQQLAPVRRLPALLEDVGLRRFEKHTFAADRTSPWTEPVRTFLRYHLRDLAKFTRGRLTDKVRREYRRFISGTRPDSLFGEAAKDLSCLNVLYVATR